MPAKKKKSVKRKKSVSTKSKLISQEDITTSTLTRIKRLELIHKERKEQHIFSDTVSFWTFLIISLVTNFFLSFILVFLIVFLSDPLLYAIVIIIGLSFGLIYSYLIHSLRHSFFHQHIYAKLFILLTGVINIIYIIITSKIILDFFGVKNNIYSHLGISLAYFISYIIPYFVELGARRLFGKAL